MCLIWHQDDKVSNMSIFRGQKSFRVLQCSVRIHRKKFTNLPFESSPKVTEVSLHTHTLPGIRRPCVWTRLPWAEARALRRTQERAFSTGDGWPVPLPCTPLFVLNLMDTEWEEREECEGRESRADWVVAQKRMTFKPEGLSCVESSWQRWRDRGSYGEVNGVIRKKRTLSVLHVKYVV